MFPDVVKYFQFARDIKFHLAVSCAILDISFKNIQLIV